MKNLPVIIQNSRTDRFFTHQEFVKAHPKRCWNSRPPKEAGIRAENNNGHLRLEKVLHRPE